MPKLHTTLEPGDVVLIPASSGASITFTEKSGKRSRVVIESNSPVTITRAGEQQHTAGPAQRVARRPVIAGS
ncbi:hypothetical protein [Stenotrophomonas acidaminiphila]|uniref:hypothetical protein n=1 Tax=Stenotrophomonas acidaminiphila TaxID=128780 RepID=UPI001FAFD19C|nr:hypothetical protein [Stenotrophomonas acidaminiphila]